MSKPKTIDLNGLYLVDGHTFRCGMCADGISDKDCDSVKKVRAFNGHVCTGCGQVRVSGKWVCR